MHTKVGVPSQGQAGPHLHLVGRRTKARWTAQGMGAGRVITVVSVNGGRSLGILKVGVEEEQRGRETRIL